MRRRYGRRGLWVCLAFAWIAGCGAEPTPGPGLSADGGAPAEEVRGSAQAISAAAEWTGWVSDGTAPATCEDGRAAAGFQCRGWYCDDARIACDPFPGTLGVSRWTDEWVSEESGRNVARCPGNEVVTGYQCNGDWCDEIMLRCAPTNFDFRASSGQCRWVQGFFSEEHSTFEAGPSEFIKGIRCQGSYCDNKQFEVCQATTVASCVGACGGQSPSRECWCDSSCTRFGDCCADFGAVCR